MDILGIWKIKSITSVEMEGDKPQLITLTREDMLKSDDSEMCRMANCLYEFTADGQLRNRMPLPEDMSLDDLDEDEKAMMGEDGLFTISTQPWKEENGKILIDSGQHREILEEVLSSWDEVKINEDGSITIGEAFPITLER